MIVTKGMATKLLYAIVILLVTLAILVFFLFRLDQAFYKVTNSGIEAFTEAGKCTVGAFDSQCGKLGDENSCLDNKDCIWCFSDVNSARVYTCRLAVCGCGSFSSEAGVEMDLNRDFYVPGDTISVHGTVTKTNIIDKTGLNVQFVFLDRNKKETSILGSGGIAVTDKDGVFDWTYALPNDVKEDRYFLEARLDKSRDIKEFSVQLV